MLFSLSYIFFGSTVGFIDFLALTEWTKSFQLSIPILDRAHFGIDLLALDNDRVDHILRPKWDCWV